jgi:serine/threonine-protein kinase
MAKLEYEAVFRNVVLPKLFNQDDASSLETPEQITTPKEGALSIPGYSELAEDKRIMVWIKKEIIRLENDMWYTFLETLQSVYGVEKKFFTRTGNDMSFDMRAYLEEKGMSLAEDEKRTSDWQGNMEEIFGEVTLMYMKKWRELAREVAKFFSIDPSLSKQFDDRYLIVGILGNGGSGKVYLTWHLHLRKMVALKIVSFNESIDPIYFKSEITNLASLEHPNIVKVFQAGATEYHGFLVMQYVGGTTLFDVIDPMNHIPLFSKKGRRGAIEIMIDLAEVVAHLHANNPPLTHNDIKPSNILFDGVNVKLADFGISNTAQGNQKREYEPEIHQIESAINAETEKNLVGTPSYIAPEKIWCAMNHLKSDIYSLGVTFFHLLTGYLPISDKKTKKLLVKVVHQEPRYLHEFRNDIPPELEMLIMFMLRKKPEERHDAETILQELRTMKEAWEQDPGFNFEMKIEDGPATHQMRLLLEKRRKRLLELAQEAAEYATHADE